MTETEPKGQILRLFLQFVESYVPLDKALLASLGGEGREAEIWQEAGIPGNHAWLIERNKRRSGRLISEQPYRYTASLRTFPRVLKAVAGKDSGVDAFHLDLCGTIEPMIEVSRPIIPLVLRSSGRCLAITVADARRNPSVDVFGTIDNYLSALLSFRYPRMRQRLEKEQGPERELAVKRELGFFYALSELFCNRNRYAVPDKVRRFEYVSRTSGAPFPMRTYFFHFPGRTTQDTSLVKFTRELYRLWFREPIHDLTRPPDQPVRASRKERLMSQGSEFDNLRRIAEAVGGPAWQEFQDMAARLEQGPAIAGRYTELVGHIQNLAVTYSANGLDPAAGLPPTDSVTSVPVKARRHSSRKTPKVVAAVINGARVEAQLELLRAKAKSKTAYDKARVNIGRRFMKSKGDDPSAVGRALLAQTQGRHRAGFLNRLSKHNPTLINEELAQLYTKITGKEVKVQDLERALVLSSAG